MCVIETKIGIGHLTLPLWAYEKKHYKVLLLATCLYAFFCLEALCTYGIGGW